MYKEQNKQRIIIIVIKGGSYKSILFVFTQSTWAEIKTVKIQDNNKTCTNQYLKGVEAKSRSSLNVETKFSRPSTADRLNSCINISILW